MKAPLDVVVLDFDGTFTDVEREGAPFLAGYRAEVVSMLGGGAEAEWAEASAALDRSPADYGWEYGGRIVAPATADPYVRATSIAQELFRRHGLSDQERGTKLEHLYRTHYARSAIAFRPDARATLEAILASGLPVYVVTNSHTDAVTKKLEALAPKGLERVRIHGDAKKYVISEPAEAGDDFRGLPESLHVDGLSRPMFVRRGHYYEVLSSIWRELRTTAARTLLCGDIFELDLAMPALLGVTTVLVARPTTPAYERAAALRHGGGGVAETLGEVLGRLELSA